MPAFVKTQKDEERWSKAKQAVERSKGKKESAFEDREWGLVNYIYHKLGKGEEDIQKAEELRKALTTAPKMPSTSIPNPAKVGQTGVRTPKPKKLAGAFDKPSLFFKSEDIKRPSIRKLSDFLENTRAKK